MARMFMFGVDEYLARLHSLGCEYAYRQASIDLALNYKGLSIVGRDKVIAAIIGWASR